MPFLIEAMVQVSNKEQPYLKVAYIDENPDVDLHLKALSLEYYRVLSVKSRPADEVELREFMTDKQGNMDCVDGVPVDATPIPDSTTD